MKQLQTIYFIDSLTGEIIQYVTVPYGGNAEAPDAPVHPGYQHIGWTNWVWENITRNQVVYALYERIPDDRIRDAEIPLAGGYISNVGDCFD